jgi:hypothetical protein
MFCAAGLDLGGIVGVRSRFYVLRARTSFRRYRGRRVPFSFFTEGVRSRFHVLRARTSFRLYGGRRVPFLCFALPNSFSAITRASGSVFLFCAPGLVFGCVDGVGSRFIVLRARTLFRRYGGRRVPFLGFALPNSFSAITRASGPVFMFCAPGLVFGGADGVGSCFHVLRGRTPFRRCRERRVPFSCFACPDSFLAVPMLSGPVFIFCGAGLIFGGTEGVG